MPVSTIADLPAPVTAAKSDWIIASTWVGFTPASDKGDAAAQCASTVLRQAAGGYVVEYITRDFGQPNPGFENEPLYLAEKAAHAKSAGRLVAVHRLRSTAKGLKEIVGGEEYERLQNLWSGDASRRRWSVAFPIVESWEIEGAPLSKEVFGADANKRIFAHQSATLRPLTTDERASLAGLRIRRKVGAAEWIAIEQEMQAAEGSPIDASFFRAIDRDLPDAAMEGMTEERKAKIRRRAAWLAQKFVRGRQRAGTLRCDECDYDPAVRLADVKLAARLAGQAVRPRSLLEAHHKDPLAEGKRLTTLADFALLCPTCHRVEHLVLKAEKAAA